MGTIPYLFGLLCLVALLGHWRPNSHLLDDKITNNQITNVSITNHQKTKQLLKIAQSQIGVREATGNNDGPQVVQYLAYTGNKTGEPWCAAFVSWVFGQAGYPQPRTAWSPNLFPAKRLVKSANQATVFGVYFPSKGRIAHAGLVETVRHNWLYTIEGNTNMAGGREGDGVYRKLRHAKTIKVYANWLVKQKGGNL